MGYWNSNYPIGIPRKDLIATQRSGELLLISQRASVVVPDMTSHIPFAYEHLDSLIAGENISMIALFVAFKSHLSLVALTTIGAKEEFPSQYSCFLRHSTNRLYLGIPFHRQQAWSSPSSFLLVPHHSIHLPHLGRYHEDHVEHGGDTALGCSRSDTYMEFGLV